MQQSTRLKDEIERVRESQQELRQGLAAESNEESIRRKDLVLLIDSIRKDKASFKKSCREEKALLDQRIEQLNADREDADQDQEEREEEQLLQFLNRQQDKLNKMNALYGDLCKDVARYQRRLDDIPSRSEVTQYQRRFVELYDQIASKHVEAKKFYILYNQLDDSRIQLEREYNLLNSVLDSFAQ